MVFVRSVSSLNLNSEFTYPHVTVTQVDTGICTSKPQELNHEKSASVDCRNRGMSRECPNPDARSAVPLKREEGRGERRPKSPLQLCQSLDEPSEQAGPPLVEGSQSRRGID
jgi:ubiquitin